MDPQHEIQKACAQLAAAGKNISVALVKARVSKQVPLAMVISAVQKWRDDPKAAAANSAKQPEKTADTHCEASIADRVNSLESQLQDALKRIKSLEAKLLNRE